MNENEISKYIVNTAYKIHVELGLGLLESVYERIMYHELVKQRFDLDSQVPIPVEWEGIKMKLGFRADLIINKKVIIEIKSVENIAPVYTK